MRIAPLAMTLLALCMRTPAQEAPRQDFSAAERLLFMDYQLGNVKPPTTLRYTFRKSGTLESGFEDEVSLTLKRGADGRCCATHTDFLSAGRRLQLPDLPSAEGNPVILHFLEREVSEMQRLTRGSQTHFRKRIRMAVYGAATVQGVTLRYRGRDVKGQEVRITPFVDDPNRPRYEQLARKEYRFLLSDALPGGLYGIRTLVAAADGASPPLLAEELTIDGAEGTNTKGERR
ncbi:MAG TPA: hypothetical protein VIW70_12045 [Rubrivivax sp.]